MSQNTPQKPAKQASNNTSKQTTSQPTGAPASTPWAAMIGPGLLILGAAYLFAQSSPSSSPQMIRAWQMMLCAGIATFATVLCVAQSGRTQRSSDNHFRAQLGVFSFGLVGPIAAIAGLYVMLNWDSSKTGQPSSSSQTTSQGLKVDESILFEAWRDRLPPDAKLVYKNHEAAAVSQLINMTFSRHADRLKSVIPDVETVMLYYTDSAIPNAPHQAIKLQCIADQGRNSRDKTHLYYTARYDAEEKKVPLVRVFSFDHGETKAHKPPPAPAAAALFDNWLTLDAPVDSLIVARYVEDVPEHDDSVLIPIPRFTVSSAHFNVEIQSVRPIKQDTQKKPLQTWEVIPSVPPADQINKIPSLRFLDRNVASDKAGDATPEATLKHHTHIFTWLSRLQLWMDEYKKDPAKYPNRRDGYKFMAKIIKDINRANSLGKDRELKMSDLLDSPNTPLKYKYGLSLESVLNPISVHYEWEK
jgi:hypothetical protein